MNRIFLIGYMGSGKTTVGRLLAARLGYGFIDMDSHIEEKQFKSVPQIFAELGEEKFRLLEQQSLHEVAEFDHVVISTGGGAPCFFDNMGYMNKRGMTVYLKLSPEELAERLESSHANKRPLLADRKGEELKQFITEGLAKREPFYAQAAYSVSGEIESTVSQICVLSGIKKPGMENKL
ncbi:MAG: shikimate kinase [Paludibacter sp.]|nr:shikimate kinase [Paludibacter sp.]